VTAAAQSPPGALNPPPPLVALISCPIAASLGTLGRKWTLTILRDVAFRSPASFSTILRNNPGLRQRTLSLRLRQLTREDLVERAPGENGSRRGGYRLTSKGQDIMPVLTALMQFGIRHQAGRVFADRLPREIEDLYPGNADLMLGRLAEYARRG